MRKGTRPADLSRLDELTFSGAREYQILSRQAVVESGAKK
jgi:hypothetical protein